MDERHGPGTFANYCTFNPNNITRLDLPWSENDVMQIFLKMVAEYQAMMDLYTKGTGGGPGASEHYADWMQRPAECVVGYIHQPCNFYLSVVHIWDKTSQWLLTDEKDPLPLNCAIDDSTTEINFHNENDDGSGDDFVLSRVHSPTQQGQAATRTPSNSSRRSLSASSAKEKRAVAALESLNASRANAKSSENEIINIMRRMEGSISGGRTTGIASKARELVEDVSRTRTLIRLGEGDLKRLKKKKRKLGTDKEKNKAKIKAIETMEKTRFNQGRRLDEMNAILEEEEVAKRTTTGPSDDVVNTSDEDSSDDDSSDDDDGSSDGESSNDN